MIDSDEQVIPLNKDKDLAPPAVSSSLDPVATQEEYRA